MTGVNDLPVEVLGHIFVLAAAENLCTSSWNLDGKKYLRLFSPESSGNRAPFVFLQVCGHWRAVAQAAYLLWTSLDVTMHKDITRTSTSIATMEHWLSFSRSGPLDFVLETKIRLTASDARKELVSAHTEAVLRVLANEGHRWRSATISMNHHLTEAFVDILLNNPNHASFRNLKQLNISTAQTYGAPGPYEDLARAIGSIKSLKELYIDMHDDSIPSLLKDIPWGQLTTVSFGMLVTADQAASFLAQSTAAVTATFKCGDTRGSDLYPDVQRCKLPKLKSLTLTGTDSLLHFFHQIHFPCLEQLWIRSDSALSCYKLLQWLAEQGELPICQLVLCVPFSEYDLADCLRIQGLRQVPHVEFDDSDIVEVAAEALELLEDDMPALWSWRPLQWRECVGWKTHFDHTDEQVTRITSDP